MKITFKCDLKEIVEAAIACQQYEKSEQSAQNESANRIIAAIFAGVSEFTESQQKEGDKPCGEGCEGVEETPNPQKDVSAQRSGCYEL